MANDALKDEQAELAAEFTEISRDLPLSRSAAFHPDPAKDPALSCPVRCVIMLVTSTRRGDVIRVRGGERTLGITM